MNDRVVGSAEFELRATRDQLKKDLALAERDLKQATGQMEQDASKSASGISGSIGKIGAAVAGVITFAAAAAVSLLAVGKASIQMAADLDDSAKKIGVTTDFLQEFQYVARKTGGETADAEAAIDSFGKKFASAAAGLSKADLDAFKALRFSQEDLRNFSSQQEAIEEIVHRISDLGSETDRVAAATKVGLGAMSYAFRDGGDAIAFLRDQAAEAGHVMDAELIQKGARAQETLDDLSSVISVQVAESFVLASDEIIAFANSLSEAIGKLNDLLVAWNNWKERANYTGDMPDETEQNAARFGPAGLLFGFARNRVRAGVRFVTGEQQQREAEYQAGFGEADEPFLQRQRASAERYTPPREPGPTTLTPVTRVPRARPDHSAEREARRSERVEQEIYRARQRLLEVAEGDLLTAQERWDLARDQLAADREARDAEIDSKAARKEYTKSEADRLRLANEEADLLEDRILTDRSLLEIRDEELANARLLSDLTADLLSLQSGAARTAAERRRIELELLEIAQKNRRDALEQQINKTPGLSEQDKVALWAANGRIEQGERAAVIRNNMGPLDQWRDASIKSAGEVQEAFERIAVDGLDALNDGLVDAIMNSRNLGEVFSNVARSILADLLKISIRQGIVEPLAGAIFGGGSEGGSGGSWLKSALGSFLGSFGRRAAGGPVSAGTPYVVGEHRAELFVPSVNGTILPDIPGSGAAQAQRFRLEVDLRSDMLDARIVDTAAPLAGQAAVAAVTIQRGENRMAQRRARQRFV